MNQPNDGKVYTKQWVVDFMLDLVGYGTNSLGDLSCMRIVEPSCGTGSFLYEIIRRLLANSSRRDYLSLKDAIRAYDIDQECVNHCKDTSRQILVDDFGVDAGTATALVSDWVVCGDFLLDHVEEDVDIVIGNPPYIRATDLDKDKRRAYVGAIESMSAGTDIYVGFFDRALDILKRGGKLCFICADRWLQNRYGKILRRKIVREGNLEILMRMHGVDAFAEGVDAYPAITLVGKDEQQERFKYVECDESFSEENIDMLQASLNSDEDGNGDAWHLASLRMPFDPVAPIPLGTKRTVCFVEQAQERLPSIEDAGISIGIGIATGCDGVFVADNPDVAEGSRMLPLFYMRDYRRKTGKHRWLVNPWDDKGNLVDLDEYPRMREYFESHRSRLENRSVVRKSRNQWYRTIDKINYSLLNKPMLLMPDIAQEPLPVYNEGRYPHHNCYWIASEQWDMCALGGVLLSRQTKDFIDCLGVKMRGRSLRFQAQYLRLLHIPGFDTLSKEIVAGLQEAFERLDRDAATKWTARMYEEAGICCVRM